MLGPSVEQHIYCQLYNIGKIRTFLDQESAEQLIHALVHSHIDYCNALLVGLPKCLISKLQMVQNTAAKVLCRVGKRLHWLPVEFRVNYKVCLLTVRALRSGQPQYLSEMFTVRSSSYSLRSSDVLTLEVPRTRCKTLGDRAFKAAAPQLWNALPANIRGINDYGDFKKKLKTHYFGIAFP